MKTNNKSKNIVLFLLDYAVAIPAAAYIGKVFGVLLETKTLNISFGSGDLTRYLSLAFMGILIGFVIYSYRKKKEKNNIIIRQTY